MAQEVGRICSPYYFPRQWFHSGGDSYLLAVVPQGEQAIIDPRREWFSFLGTRMAWWTLRRWLGGPSVPYDVVLGQREHLNLLSENTYSATASTYENQQVAIAAALSMVRDLPDVSIVEGAPTWPRISLPKLLFLTLWLGFATFLLISLFRGNSYAFALSPVVIWGLALGCVLVFGYGFGFMRLRLLALRRDPPDWKA